MTLAVNVDIRAPLRYFGVLRQKQIPFATALALTKTAQAGNNDTVEQMRVRFDRPKPWTLKATFVRPAKKRDLVASFGLKDITFEKSIAAAELLEHLFTGGPRVPRRFERALIRGGLMSQGERLAPGRDVPRDAYGNVRGGIVQRVASQIRIGDPATYRTDSKRSKASRKGSRYFWSYGGRFPRGVWEARGARGRKVRAIMLVVPSPVYRRLININRIAEQAAASYFPAEFSKALDFALRTAK